MKKYILTALIATSLFSCKPQDKKKEVDIDTNNTNQVTSVTALDYEGLKPLLEKQNDTIYVVNFWATWCAPCVKELPYFEKINKTYKDKNVEVLLVSLDFPNQVDKKLIPYINQKKLQSKVVLLDDTNENVWINAIDESWSGAIPATLIYNKNKRKFYEQSFDYETLENELQTFLKS